MTQSRLLERIQKIIESFENGNQTAFAKRSGVSQSTLSRNLADKDDKLLMNITGWILLAYPTVSRAWLLEGEGEMLDDPNLLGPLSAHNRAGNLVGDLLYVALESQGLSAEKAAAKTGIAASDLKLMLEGRLYPNFAHFDALYHELHIDPSYFFDGDEHWMHIPEDPLLRVLWAIGKATPPTSGVELASILGMPLKDGKELYAEWKEDRAAGKNRPLTKELLDHLRGRYTFNAAWLCTLDPPVIVPKEDVSQRIAEPEALVAAREEVSALKDEVLNLQRKLLAMHETVRGQ